MKDRRMAKSNITFITKGGVQVGFLTPHEKADLLELFNAPKHGIVWVDTLEKAENVASSQMRIVVSELSVLHIHELELNPISIVGEIPRVQ